MSASEPRLRHYCRALEALVWLALARILIGFVPFHRWSGTLGLRGKAGPYRAAWAPSALDARSIGKAVERAALRAPFTTVCLPRAMACQWMLRRRRIVSDLVFSAMPGAMRRGGIHDLHAHVECSDGLLIGLLDQPLVPVLALKTGIAAPPS